MLSLGTAYSHMNISIRYVQKVGVVILNSLNEMEDLACYASKIPDANLELSN